MHLSRYLSLGANSKLVHGDPTILADETHNALCICKDECAHIWVDSMAAINGLFTASLNNSHW